MKRLHIAKVTIFILLTQAGNALGKLNQKTGLPIKVHAGINRPIAPLINISDEARKESADILNKVLSDEYVLLVQTNNYHWNVVGPEFHDYHLLFGDQYKIIFEIIDSVAERVRAVGEVAFGSMTDFLSNSDLKEDVGDVPAPKEMISRLLANHEALIQYLREGINATAKNDMGTSNFLTDLIEKHEKIAWMLRSLLERR